jgi:hypothetical protein
MLPNVQWRAKLSQIPAAIALAGACGDQVVAAGTEGGIGGDRIDVES